MPQVLPLWITEAAGLFQQHGLDIDLHLIVSTQEMAALLAGDTQIANTAGPDVLNAEANGADLVVTAVPMGISPFSIWAGPEIHSMADLKGKSVGISQFGSPSELEMRLALQNAGLDPWNDVTFVPNGSTQARTAALIQGSIQGAAENPLEGAKLQQQDPALHVIMNMSSQSEPFAETAATSRRDWLSQNPALMQDYIDAVVEGLQREKTDKTFAVSVLEKYYQTSDEASMSAAYDAYISLFPDLPTPTTDQFQAGKTLLSQSNPAIAAVDLNRIVDPQFVLDAQRRGLGAS